jgi:hypothetical protein
VILIIMLPILTLLVFLISGFVCMETLQKVHPAAPLVNPIFAAMSLGCLHFVWTMGHRFWFSEISLRWGWAVLFPLLGAIAAAALSLTLWYWKDSTGKGQTTLRNAHLLLGIYQAVLYSLVFTLSTVLVEVT